MSDFLDLSSPELFERGDTRRPGHCFRCGKFLGDIRGYYLGDYEWDWIGTCKTHGRVDAVFDAA